jgi:hypothetical protein
MPTCASGTGICQQRQPRGMECGYFQKIFKKDAGKIGLYANDILNDNKGFTRTIQHFHNG